MASLNTTASSGPACNSADHRDSNYPHDLEYQSRPHRSVFTKKRVLIAGGVVTTVFVVIAAIVCGVALARKDDDKDVDAPASTIAANAATSAPFEMQTVIVDATTVVHTTTRVSLLVATSLATSTISLATPRTPDAPLRPVAAETIFPKPTPSIPVPSEASIGDVFIAGCFFNGAWPLKERCEKHCPSWDGHETRCEVSKRSQWVCVSCPSQP